MEDKTQKERLEQELRFLKESFEAEVISKEEYEKGIERIEGKLKEIGNSAKPAENGQSSEAKEEGQKKEDAAESIKADKIKLKVIQDEPQEQEYFEPSEEKETVQKGQSEAPASNEPEKKGKFFRYAVAFAVLALVIFFSYSLLAGKKNVQEDASKLKFTAACNADGDCIQKGKEGTCLNQGTKDAKCEFREIQKTDVLVLNGRNDCFNCNAQRVLNILESWFGAVNAREIDYNTDEGRNLADKVDARALPAYILDGNITKKPKFSDLKQAFARKDGYYVLSEDAAGSTFYFKRENIPNKLDFFADSRDGAGIKAEKNLKEFLDAFPEAKFDKHNADDALTKELGIKTFPTFLINNRVKFSGVAAAETIKSNFCRLNELPACEESLAKSLV